MNTNTIIEFGEYGHIASKYQKFLELVDKLSPDVVSREILPAWLDDEELTNFIEWMEERLQS